MRGVVIRPLSAAATKYRRQALRFARELGNRTGAVTRNMGGFLFRAMATETTITVYIIDPPSVWSFVNNVIGVFDYPVYLYGTTDLVTASKQGLVLPPDDPVELLTPEFTIPTDSKLRIPVIPVLYTAVMQNGVFNAILGYGRTSYAGSQLAGAYVAITVPNTGAENVPMSTPLRTYCIAQTQAQKTIQFTNPLPEEVSANPRLHRSFVFDEGVLQSFTGSPTLRMWPRMIRGENQYFAHSLFTVPTFDPAIADGVDPYAANVILLPFVEQADEGPGSSSVPPTPAEVEARFGYMLMRVRCIPRAADSQDPAPPLFFSWTRAFRQVDNPVAELRPAVAEGDLFRHAMLYGSVSATDTQGVAAVTLLAQSAVVDDVLVEHYGLQIRTINMATGTTTLVTPYLAQYNELDAALDIYELYNDLRIEGAPRVVFCRRSAIRNNGNPSASKGPTRGEILDLTLIDGETDVGLIAPGGTLLTLGARTAGWQPYTSLTRGAYSAMPQVTFGSYSYARLRIVEHIGSNRLVCIAHPADQVTADTLDWHLVVLDATTGAFIESRGLIATTPAKIDQRKVYLSMAVVQPEVVTEDGIPEVVSFCVLNVSVVHDVASDGDLASRTTYFSNDGGHTWRPVFTGMMGEAFYLGNPLRYVDVGTNGT